jgi:hypothetical protein
LAKSRSICGFEVLAFGQFPAEHHCFGIEGADR